MAKKLTREELLARMTKRVDRMERDAVALGKEMAQVDEFYYTAENIIRDVTGVARDLHRIVLGQKI